MDTNSHMMSCLLTSYVIVSVSSYFHLSLHKEIKALIDYKAHLLEQVKTSLLNGSNPLKVNVVIWLSHNLSCKCQILSNLEKFLDNITFKTWLLYSMPLSFNIKHCKVYFIENRSMHFIFRCKIFSICYKICLKAQLFKT